MSTFRFVHAADVHLDSPLKGLTGDDGAVIDQIRSAPREAFEALVARTIDEAASFLIIAGDLYDGEWRDFNTGQFFVRQMGRLREAGIPAYVIHGNHDAESKLTRSLPLPDNVTVFSTRRPETHRIDALGVSLHGQGFRVRDVTDNLARSYPEPDAGNLNIGILHTGLGGQEGHANYAPCTLDDLVGRGYDYWALGHIHKPSVLHERPYVVYSGNVQGRHIREEGPRGAVLVTVEDGEIRRLNRFHVDVVRWELVTVDAGGCESVQEVSDRIADGIERAVSEKGSGRLVACRIQVTGRTGAHGRLQSSLGQMVADAKAVAAGLGQDRAWVEKVVLKTRREGSGGPDPNFVATVGDLSDARKDENLVLRLKNDIAKLIAKLPPELRQQQEDPLLLKAIEGDYKAVIEMASDLAIDRMLEGGD